MEFGLFNYSKAGKGVAKNGPEKKPFFKFWELFARKFWYFITLNFVYLVFCLPLVTFGPATAALTHVMRKFYLEDPIFPVNEFWTAFKKNFKQSVGIGIVDVIFIASFLYTTYYLMGLLENDMSVQNFVITGMTIALAVYFLMMHFYIYLQIVALNLKMKAIIKNSILLTVLGIKRNILSFFIFSFFALLIWFFLPWSSLVLPVIPFAWLAFTITFISYPVIQKNIINPFYEAKGEVNPELIPKGTDGEAVFTDLGGSEPTMNAQNKSLAERTGLSTKQGGEKISYVRPKGKVIK